MSQSPPSLGGSGLTEEKARPSSPFATEDNEPEIPEGDHSARLSPALDPVMRMQLSSISKWILLFGVLLIVAWLPAHLNVRTPLSVPGAAGIIAQHNLFATAAAAVFAAAIATGLPRTLFPNFFGRWFEAVEAFRDWVVVGLTTGGLFYGAIQVLRAIVDPILKKLLAQSGEGVNVIAKAFNVFVYGKTPPETYSAEQLAYLAKVLNLYKWYYAQGLTNQLFDPIWLERRLPILLVCALVGILLARLLAIRGQGIVSGSFVSAILQVLVQVALVGLMFRPLEKAFNQLSITPMIAPIMLIAGLACVAGSLGLVLWAFDADKRLSSLHQMGHPDWSGVAAANEPVPMNITLIGGRECGKTVLMAASFYEWSTQSIGDLRIVPSRDGGIATIFSGTDLEKVATDLYVNYMFPPGTTASQQLPFDLMHGNERVVHFNLLDYPGGALSGAAADKRILDAFWERVDNSDAIMLIADMSYVRRGRKDPDFLQVQTACREVMKRLINRNGKGRVVPVALVLTKCDEFADLETGRIDFEALEQGLRDFDYRELEREWRSLVRRNGNGVVEFTTWITSAVTYSEPQVDPMTGLYDYSKPFRLKPAPPQIRPTGCASPLLWLTAKVMRWNVTLFQDFSSFIIGSTPKSRTRINAMLELERIAEERAATPS